jgi:hypothetical protein
MSKGNRNSTQALPSRKSLIQTREKPPIPLKTKSGVELLCPFCADHHPLLPGQESPCGTHIEVTAVQEIVSARLSRTEGLVCVKCHKEGGEMVRYRNGFVHLADCNPGTRLLQEVPTFSLFAKVVHNLNPKVRGLIERLTGRADQVLEIDEKGDKTGKVLGYFFYKTLAQKE